MACEAGVFTLVGNAVGDGVLVTVCTKPSLFKAETEMDDRLLAPIWEAVVANVDANEPLFIADVNVEVSAVFIEVAALSSGVP